MPTTDIINHYEVLDVPLHATLKDINHAYKRLALKHHPDKAVDGDVDKFQQIQEAAETLRDPYRRKKHDHDLRTQRTGQAYAAGRGGRGFYTKWMPRTFGMQSKAEFYYMYSYANSVHMSPYSKESIEEMERIEREKRFDEMVRARGHGSAEHVLRRSEQKGRGAEERRPEERRPQEAYRAKVEGDLDEPDDDEGSIKGEGEEKCVEEAKEEEQKIEHKEGFGQKYEQEGDYEEEYGVGHGEELGQDENVQQAELRPASPVDEAVSKDHENEEDNRSSNSSGEVSSEYGTAQETEYMHSDEDGDIFSQDKPTIDEDEITMFFDCAEDKSPRINTAENTDTDSFGEESQTSDEEVEHEDNRVNSHNRFANTSNLLVPFIPHFMSKLNDPSGKYTEQDLQIELRGIVMEAYCGWLEEQCATFSAVKPQSQPSLFTSDCLHLGYWKKEFERPECEACHRWKPIFTLTCPGCGIKACVGCKFHG